MSGKFLARASALSLAFMLAACGGDDSSSPLAGTPDQGGSGTPNAGDDSGNDNEQTPEGDFTVGSLRLTASPVQMGTTESAEAIITAFAKDESNVLLTDIPIQFSVDNDAALNKRVLETDERGRATNVLSTPSNAQNRVATVSATAGDQEATITISISGTSLSLNGPTSVSLDDSANDSAQFFATLQNSSNQGVALEQIAIENSNSSNAISWATNVTSDDGRVAFNYSANTSGADQIKVTAFSGENILTATKTITVSDNTFKFSSPADNEIPIKTPTNITLTWEEDGTPIAGEDVAFFSSRGEIASPNTVTTDATGNATVSIQSPTAGPAIIEAKAIDPATYLEISAQRQYEFVATVPASLTLQPDRTQLEAKEASKITAIVRDMDGNLVKNQTVSFTIAADVSSGTLFPPSATTDSLGRASTTFNAGENPTGRDAVEISSTVEGITEKVKLTVSGGASRLTIGTGNELTEPDSDHYTKDWVVFVTDVNGEPVEDAEVELSVIPVSFGKGEFVLTDTDGDGTPDIWNPLRATTCPSEDINRNGSLDSTETDVNGNGKLDPTNEAVVSTTNNKTDEEGSVHLGITYPQSSCAWTDVLVEARASVSGTEYSESAVITLSCLAGDLLDLEITPPSFNGGSKYGKAADCSTSD